MYELTVKITAEHIRHGTRRNCKNCPLALALLEYFEDFVIDPDLDLYVDGEIADITWFPDPASSSSHALRMVLQYDARLFVDDFDKGEAVEPQTVHLSF